MGRFAPGRLNPTSTTLSGSSTSILWGEASDGAQRVGTKKSAPLRHEEVKAGVIIVIPRSNHSPGLTD